MNQLKQNCINEKNMHQLNKKHASTKTKLKKQKMNHRKMIQLKNNKNMNQLKNQLNKQNQLKKK